MDIYNYHPTTKEYVSTTIAKLDPIDELPLIPAHATTIIIPTILDGYTIIFNGSSWDNVEDNRNLTTYNILTQEESVIDHLGQIDTDYTELVPSSAFDNWNGTTWIFDLIKYKNSKIEEIDNISENQRLKYITGGVGQALTYQEKSEQASDYIVAGSPIDLTPYPFIQAEVNATGKDSTTAANDILSAQSLWISKGSSIEEYRIKAKIDLLNATLSSDIDNIFTLAQSNIESI